jgi:hypothetical protein
MLEKIKELLSNWKITVTLVGGALVIATAYGTCTMKPDLEAPAADEAESVSGEGEAAVLDVITTDANNTEEAINSNVEVKATEATEETVTE